MGGRMLADGIDKPPLKPIQQLRCYVYFVSRDSKTAKKAAWRRSALFLCDGEQRVAAHEVAPLLRIFKRVTATLQ